jgi:cell fate regulator YaaT (PSP1 superfamily)
MPEIVGVRFRSCGKIYDFESEGLTLKPGDLVIVESEMGLSIGTVVQARGIAVKEEASLETADAPPAAEDLPLKEGREEAEEEKEQRHEHKELKKVLRMASEEDLKENESNARLKKEAFDFCKERVMARGLQMKLIRTDVTLDRKRIIFYFVSEKRIDFRELVKDLAQKFRTRIEMRQVGVRDEAKFTGGLGICGRPLCCTSFLVEFAPISIKMAKKQELVLNTGKLSGCCGRLMCCLSYEYRDAADLREEEENLINEREVETAEAEEAPAQVIEPEIIHPHEMDQEEIVREAFSPESGAAPAAREGEATGEAAKTGEQRKRKKRRWKRRGKGHHHQEGHHQRGGPKPST